MKPATPIVIAAAALSSGLAFAQMPTPGIVLNPGNQNGEAEMRELISTPKTAADFIRNIKYSFDNNLFLDDRFFEKNNACKAFSIDEKTCIPHQVYQADGTRGMTLIANTKIFLKEQNLTQPHSTAPVEPTATVQILIDKRVDPLGIVSGGINFNLEKGGPDFRETVEILNTNLSRIIEMPPHGKIPLPITGPHGDETWRYEASDKNFRKRLTVGFRENGTLDSMLVEVDEIGGHQ
jgi:hypothetical protein